jgi:hypothetical protein
MIQKQPIWQFSDNILKKPWLLTFIGVLAIGHIGIMAFQNDLLSIGIFFIITFLLSFFTDYWVVILCVGMTISACFQFQMEGFDTVRHKDGHPKGKHWAREKVDLMNEIINAEELIQRIKRDHQLKIDIKNGKIRQLKDVRRKLKDRLLTAGGKFKQIKTTTTI